jgi:hypothetical protein
MAFQPLFALDCVPDGSMHFIPFNSVDLPCYESFAAGSSKDLCHMARFSKSVLRDVIPSIRCSTQLPMSAVDVMRVSWG